LVLLADHETEDPDDRKGRLKDLGGPQLDRWNNVLANPAMQAF
jgi:hypothetical protein